LRESRLMAADNKYGINRSFFAINSLHEIVVDCPGSGVCPFSSRVWLNFREQLNLSLLCLYTKEMKKARPPQEMDLHRRKYHGGRNKVRLVKHPALTYLAQEFTFYSRPAKGKPR
jgi:hypothetical protein